MITEPDVRYVTVDGVTVGWDVCAVCRRHVRQCRCDAGPVEPAYLSDGAGGSAGVDGEDAV